jgi:hypothetical protein
MEPMNEKEQRMNKEEAQQRIDEATAAYTKAANQYPPGHPEHEAAFQVYKQTRIECTYILYGKA